MVFGVGFFLRFIPEVIYYVIACRYFGCRNVKLVFADDELFRAYHATDGY
jgi:hypothetical protein